ncbi:hypothetical protein HCH54_003805 [Aspergillus fumigatus]
MGKASLESGDRFDKTLRIVDESKQRMVDTGFVEVVERRYKLPIGLWSKDKHLKTLGKCFRLVIEESMEMWVMYLWTQVLGLTPAEVEMTIAEKGSAPSQHPRLHPCLGGVWPQTGQVDNSSPGDRLFVTTLIRKNVSLLAVKRNF